MQGHRRPWYAGSGKGHNQTRIQGQVHEEMGMRTQETWISTWRTRTQGIRTRTWGTGTQRH